MAILTMDQLTAAMERRSEFDILKSTVTTYGVGAAHSLWQVPGTPGPGATPASGAGTIPTSASAGSLKYTAPAGGRTNYLARLNVSNDAQGRFSIGDRLWGNSGLSFVGGAQAFVSTPLARSVTRGGLLYLEVYTGAATGAGSVTATYTNQDGTGSRTATFTIPGDAVTGQLIAAELQSGDTSVRSVEGIASTTGLLAAGDFGLTLFNRIASAGMLLGNPADRNAIDLGLPPIEAGACLTAILSACSGVASGTLTADGLIVQG